MSLPEEWPRDPPRRQTCHGPEAVASRPRQAQCGARRDLGGAQVPHGGVTGEDERGRPPRLRQQRRERGECYVLRIPGTTPLRALEAPWPMSQGRGQRPKPPGQALTAWRTSLGPDGWTRLTVRAGAKGPVAIEMVPRRGQTRIARQRTGPAAWLLVTRHPLADAATLESRASREATAQAARSRSPYSLTPTDGCEVAGQAAALSALARVIQAGAWIAASFTRGQSEAGLDPSQGRPWEGWHHPLALPLIAGWCWMGETHRGQQRPPALTLPQGRYGLSLLLLEVYDTSGVDDICRQGPRP